MEMKRKKMTFTEIFTVKCFYKIVLVLLILSIGLRNCGCLEFLDSELCQEKCFCEVSARSGYDVDCTAKNLTSLPGNLNENILKLDLSMNNLTYLPNAAFFKLRRLDTLFLVGNSLTSLPPKVFSGLYQLINLFLQGNLFQEVPSRALNGLQSLKLLYLDANRISKVPSNSFKNLPKLNQLRLDANQLTRVPVKALSHAKSLEAVDLNLNLIETVPDLAFHNLTNLVVLILSDNHISYVGPRALEGLPVLGSLFLNKNRLKHIPSAIEALPDLATLDVSNNMIEFIADGTFAGNKKLEVLELQDNPISSVGEQAFRNLPFLENLKLSEARDMTVFPDLTETKRLERLVLDRACISVIPANICQHMDFLQTFDVHSNKVTQLPDMSRCSLLTQIILGNNEISSLEPSPFRGLENLKDLTLGYNYISYIPEDAFEGLTSLEYLDLSHNRISSIHPDAFAGLTGLENLNLAENRFSVLPTKGLDNLRRLQTFHNKELLEPPPYDAFPKVQTLALAYAYHCCDFIRRSNVLGNSVGQFRFQQDLQWLENPNITSLWPTAGNHTTYIHPIPLPDDILVDSDDSEQYTDLYADEYLPAKSDVDDIVLARPPVDCRPTPGPFLPCDDLFGWWSLRCGVWIVFLLAVLGNGAVLFVSITSKSKMDVTRFLVCNLACADLFMGIYLGFLAIVDASTLGEFEKYAVRWQISPGCLVAGFLGVLSSELSVFTLTIITVERFYAISNAMQLDKRLSLKSAGYIMSAGWFFCLSVASLPLFEVSDYRKFAICLPFETENSLSLGYVCFIMIFNAVSFLVIVCCYIAMYVTIRGSHAWNSNDTIVAKRMALLVFTDFFCWAPIIFFSITAAFESNFAKISLDEAKVLTIFVLPLNSCANPFLYAFFTRQFKKDCVKLCKRIEESSLSRHFPSSGIRRPSNSSNRQSQSNTYHVEKHAGSCSNSVSAGSSCGEMSNNNCDSDITVKKVHFNKKDEALQYVRSDSGVYLGDSKSIQLSDMSPESDQRGKVKLTIDSAVTETNLNDNEEMEDGEFVLGSTPDIVLHTQEGHIYLNTATISATKARPAVVTRNKEVKKCDRHVIKVSKESKKKVAQQNRSNDLKLNTGENDVTVMKRHKREDSSSKNIPVSSESEMKSSEQPVKRCLEISPVLKQRSSERKTQASAVDSNVTRPVAADTGVRGVRQKHPRGNRRISAARREGVLTAATQTDIDIHVPDYPSLPPGAVDKKDRRKQINEWRKTSHLSFLWRNADNFDALLPKQKSNSLVELTRPVRDYKAAPSKRHSFSSHHEGYILLKNGSRESTYEDEDLYEFHDGRVVYVPHAKLKNVRNPNKYSIVPQARKTTGATRRARTQCASTEDSPETDDACETSNLLTDYSCGIFRENSLKQRKSCDEESGISLNS